MWLTRCLQGLVMVLLVAYPMLVYIAIDRLNAVWVAGLLCTMALLRYGWRRDALSAMAALAAGGVCLLSWLSGRGDASAGWLPLKFYPVAVNALLLVFFAFSLFRPPSMVERLARLREPELPPAGVRYTHQVTRVWCVFFILNGSVACLTAVWGTDKQWALYNGLLSYVLMGALGLGEWLLRRHLQASNAL